jgi:flavin reductase (DIM6/NTAB) family NADH-FMN oxidoreductase RutF
MKREPVGSFDLWADTMGPLRQEGILLCTVDREGRPNAMTIGWITGGVIWSRPILTVLVRPSRHTYSRLEEVPEFTVNVLPRSLAPACELCGTKSGRDLDKFAAAKLTPVPSLKVRPPSLAEALVVWECRVVHRNDVVPANLSTMIKATAYPQGDFHRIYDGEILGCFAAPGARAQLAARG